MAPPIRLLVVCNLAFPDAGLAMTSIFNWVHLWLLMNCSIDFTVFNVDYDGIPKFILGMKQGLTWPNVEQQSQLCGSFQRFVFLSFHLSVFLSFCLFVFLTRSNLTRWGAIVPAVWIFPTVKTPEVRLTSLLALRPAAAALKKKSLQISKANKEGFEVFCFCLFK